MKTAVFVFPFLALLLSSCADPGEDGAGADAVTFDVLPDVEADASRDAGVDAGDARTDVPETSGGPDTTDGVDAEDAFEVTDAMDVSGADGEPLDAEPADASDSGDTDDDVEVENPLDCPCDVTVVCDDSCACDIACRAVPGPPPLGPDTFGAERSEVAVFHATSAGAPVSALTVYDDGFASTHALLGTASLDIPAVHPMALSADLDDDARDETILVSPTGVVVHDWDGGTLSGRTVYTYPTADWFDAAFGDLDMDGGRNLVVTRQVGDVVTIDVLDVGETGEATVRASVEMPSVFRHAVAVAPPSAGERPRLYFLSTRTHGRYASEPAELVVFGLDGSTLAEESRSSLASFCGLGDRAELPDDGLAMVVGNVNELPGNEITIAAYCTSPASGAAGTIRLAIYDPEGESMRMWTPEELEYDTEYTATGRIRPALAMGRVNTSGVEAGDPGKMMVVVGWSSTFSGATVLGFQTASGAGTGRLTPSLQVNVLESVLTGMAVRDVNRDGVDDVVTATAQTLNPCGSDFPCDVYDGTRVTVHNMRTRGTQVVFDNSATLEMSVVPSQTAVALGDLDRDSARMRATGNVYRHVSAPYVTALIAAPPTWIRDDVRHADGAATTFGQSDSSGSISGGNVYYGSTLTVSMGVSLYKLLELYGEVTATAESAFVTETEEVVTVGRSISAGPEADLVAFARTVYASYEYEIIANSDPEMIGELMLVDVPDSMVHTTTSLADFRAAYPYSARMVPTDIFTHRVGRPDTYNVPGTCTNEYLQSQVGTGVVGEAYETGLTDVGSAPSGSFSLSLDVSTQTSTGFDVSLEVGGLVGATLVVGASLTAWVGGGYSYRTTIGSGVSYSGSVGVISEGYGIDTRYEWGLCVFHWADDAELAEFASYPVITYVVKRY